MSELKNWLRKQMNSEWWCEAFHSHFNIIRPARGTHFRGCYSCTRESTNGIRGRSESVTNPNES